MASLFEHDHNSTLSAPGQDSILQVYKKLAYYHLDRLGWRYNIKNTNIQLVVEVQTQVLRLVGPVSNQLGHSIHASYFFSYESQLANTTQGLGFCFMNLG